MEKKLIVYFTYTNHTKMIADKIQKKLNCDILEIKPEKAYSTDYNTVVDEQQNNESTKETPNIINKNLNLTEYDEIILGTPVWWYTITPPIRTFLTENDLSNKKIIPFATNAGWLGRTFKEIQSLCPNSTVANELNIVYDEAGNRATTDTEINKWIESL